MAEIGALVANLELQTAAFRKELDKAVAHLNSSSAKMNQVFASIERRAKQMNTVVGGFLTVWVGGRAVAAINNALELADSIGKQAENAGLSARAFQELAYAQMQSGGSQEGLSKALLQFNRVLGEAANGSAKAAQALALVGIQVEDLRSQSVEQLYVRATTTLAGYTDTARRATAIQKLFGDEALKTATAFTVSADDLARLRAEAHAVGVVLDEQTIKNAARAKDEMERFSRIISIQLTNAFVQFAPLLVKATGFIAQLGEMASWAARRIGLLQNVTLEQQYQALLEKRVDITENLARLEHAQRAGAYYLTPQIEEARKQLASLDKELADIRAKMAANERAGAEGTAPALRPAISPDVAIKPVGGEQQLAKFQALMDGLRKEAARAQTDILADEHAKMQARIQLAESEWRAKADAAKLTVEQRKQFEAELQQFLVNQAAVEAQQRQAKLDQERQEIFARFEALRASYDEEFAAEQERRQRLLELDQYYKEFGLEQDALYHQLRERIELEHLARLGDMQAKAKLEALKLDRQTASQRLATALQFGQDELAAVAHTNKALFDLQKAFSLSQLAVEMPSAIGAAIEKAGGLPWGAWAGVATAAKYVALIAQARSAKLGAGAVPTGAGGMGALSAATGLPEQPEVPDVNAGRRAVVINVQFQTTSRLVPLEEIDNFLRELGERVADGASEIFGTA